MFGGSMAERRQRMEAGLTALKAVWRGEPFEWKGSRILVRPRPAQASGPPICYGGDSVGAARRAALLADAFMPVPGSVDAKTYVDEC